MLGKDTAHERPERHQATIQEKNAHDPAAHLAGCQELEHGLVLGLIRYHTYANAEGTDGRQHEVTRRGKTEERDTEGQRPNNHRGAIAIAPPYRGHTQSAKHGANADNG